MLRDISSSDVLTLYLAKLSRRCPLPERDRQAILRLEGVIKRFLPGDKVVAAGSPATHCVILGLGFVSRQKTLSNGTCQILALHLPGDAVDLQAILFVDADHDIKAHIPTVTLWVPYEDILELCESHPVVSRALWLDSLADASIFREWTANVGQRNARERIAHLYAELHSRYDAVGAVKNDCFHCPLTQTDLANALGLSLVHLNKSLKTLRQEGLVQIDGRTITITNVSGLRMLGGFDPEYLHLDGKRVKNVSASPGDAVGELITQPMQAAG